MKKRNLSVEVEGSTPLSWTKYVKAKKADEDADEYEERIFAQRMHHVNGNVGIPTMAMKRAIETAASKLGKKFGRSGVKGVLQGALIPEGLLADTGVPIDEIGHDWLFLPQGGKKNSCVEKKIPVVNDWSATFSFTVVDKRITDELMRELVLAAGLVVGLGFWRPEKGGIKGRFTLKDMAWANCE